jgi:hypothetical protein
MADPKSKSIWQSVQDSASQAASNFKHSLDTPPPPRELSPEEQEAESKRLAPKQSQLKKFGLDYFEK